LSSRSQQNRQTKIQNRGFLFLFLFFEFAGKVAEKVLEEESAGGGGRRLLAAGSGWWWLLVAASGSECLVLELG
jgi:hypothetical protein